MIRITDIKLPIDGSMEQLLKKAAKALRIQPEEIRRYQIYRRSLDARKKDYIHYVYAIDVEVNNQKQLLQKNKDTHVSLAPDFAYHVTKSTMPMAKPPVVVGFGPAGMFAGLLLAQMGLKPVIVERGGDVESRKKAVEHFWESGELDTQSNVQFGEGGAGTFSDGKLTTRIKDVRCRKVLEEFVLAGAPEEILFEAKPHIGTDLLQGVVKKMREEIIRLGGEVCFFSKMTDIEIKDQQVQAIVLENGDKIETNDVVLALGHSARDTFELLHEKEISIAQKPFAMGVRIEHTQEMVNQAQYGAGNENLPAADYKLTHTTKAGRGVYTFCMCPGGYVVGAASEEGRLAINGMSEHARDGKNANSALLVQVFPEDFGSQHPLAGVHFQRELEEKAFLAGGGNYHAPTQSVGSFLGKVNCESIEPTYRPGTKEANMTDIFPSFMIESLKESILAMGKRLKGFDSDTGILTAVESRSSSPVRILRNEMGESVSVLGLYPTGEGAGYAGGIVSAAVDGILIAEKIQEKYRNKE